VRAAPEVLPADHGGAGAERAPGIALGVRDHRHDVPHVEVLRQHDFLAGTVRHLHRGNRIAQRLHRPVLDPAWVLDVEELGDAFGAGEDVVADPRVRVALDPVEEEGSAAVEVLLDRGDLEVRIDLHIGADQLADGLEVLEGRAQAPDVLLHAAPSGDRTLSRSVPRPSGPARSVGSDTAPVAARRQGAAADDTDRGDVERARMRPR
jgi:hypothetical protein